MNALVKTGLLLLCALLVACQESDGRNAHFRGAFFIETYQAGGENWVSPSYQDGLFEMFWSLPAMAYPLDLELRLGTRAYPAGDDLLLMSLRCEYSHSGCWREDSQAFHLDTLNQLWRIDSGGRFIFVSDLTYALAGNDRFTVHFAATDGHREFQGSEPIRIY